MDSSVSLIITAVLIFIVNLILFVLLFNLIAVWMRGVLSGVWIGFFHLLLMRMRKVDIGLIMTGLIEARRAGLNLSASELETHYLASGNVLGVVDGLIAASEAGVQLTFPEAAGLDLRGRNVFEEVQISIDNGDKTVKAV